MSKYPKELVLKHKKVKTPSVRKIIYRIVSRVNPEDFDDFDPYNSPEISNEVVRFLDITLTFRKERSGKEILTSVQLTPSLPAVNMYLSEV
jgi:hypothetical protein